jgi:hypothetical protein
VQSVSRRALLLTLTALVAVLVPSAPAPASTASSAAALPPYRINVHASATTVEANQVITFAGKVRPATAAARKQNVKLQVTYPNGAFETAGLDRPNRKGRFSFATSFSAPGDYLVRARIAAGKGHSEGISTELKITVVPLSVP